MMPIATSLSAHDDSFAGRDRAYTLEEAMAGDKKTSWPRSMTRPSIYRVGLLRGYDRGLRQQDGNIKALVERCVALPDASARS